MSILKFAEKMTVEDLRQTILACGNMCYDRKLMTSNDGNISVRVGEDRMLITASGVCKGRMTPDDLLLLSLDGDIIAAAAGRKPSSETPMHLEVYRHRADVRAIIHAHPVFATTLTVAGVPFPVDVLPEVLLTLGEVPTSRYATPSSHDDAEAIREWLPRYDAILLRQHGSLTYGKDLETALIHLERIEHVAEVYWRAKQLGHVERIPAQAMKELTRLREKYFGN